MGHLPLLFSFAYFIGVAVPTHVLNAPSPPVPILIEITKNYSYPSPSINIFLIDEAKPHGIVELRVSIQYRLPGSILKDFWQVSTTTPAH
eukprot:6735904-Pyramimonas_sp.AAC.1